MRLIEIFRCLEIDWWWIQDDCSLKLHIMSVLDSTWLPSFRKATNHLYPPQNDDFQQPCSFLVLHGCCQVKEREKTNLLELLPWSQPPQCAQKLHQQQGTHEPLAPLHGLLRKCHKIWWIALIQWTPCIHLSSLSVLQIQWNWYLSDRGQRQKPMQVPKRKVNILKKKHICLLFTTRGFLQSYIILREKSSIGRSNGMEYIILFFIMIV
jgi:hypothetical protein